MLKPAVLKPTVLESSTSLARGFRVQFYRQDDRVAHQVELVRNGIASQLLASFEGASSDRCPPSPPLQQLHTEERGPQSRVALLVGMAGRNHWSMSVELGPDGQWVVFDVACRMGSESWQLGTTYELGPHSPTDLEWTPRVVRSRQIGWELSTEPAGNEAAGLLSLQGSSLQIQAPAPFAGRATVRWKYRLASLPS